MITLAEGRLASQTIRSSVRVIRRFVDQDLSLTDGVGLYLMAERRSTSCWSTDFHLGLTGVPLVINQVP